MLWRIPLQLLVVPLSTLVLGLAVILFCPLDPTRRLFNHLSRLWSRILCTVAGIRVQVEGLENVDPMQPAVFVANHQSLLDPPVLFGAIPSTLRVIAKRSLFLVPIFGQALWAAGVIAINRKDRRHAMDSMKHAAERIRSGVSVLVFAEGTRSRDGQLQPLKKGAFVLAIEAGVPMQPVLVTGTRDLLSRGAFFPRPGTVRITFLPPISTAEMTYDNRDRLLARVAHAMQDRLATGPAAAMAKVPS